MFVKDEGYERTLQDETTSQIMYYKQMGWWKRRTEKVYLAGSGIEVETEINLSNLDFRQNIVSIFGET